MGDRLRKDVLFESFARMGKALASPRRLEMLELLAQGERSVEQLAEAAGLSVANASRHLQVLRTAGMVESRRNGVRILYRPSGDEVMRLWVALRDAAAARLGDVERAARDYLGEDVEAIGHDELLARMRRGDVVVIDVRPRIEFEAGHIQGARSIPLGELEERLADLPADAEVVAYCRGPYCVYAHEAVRRLQETGRQAVRLEGGWPEWRLAALPAATDESAGSSRRRENTRRRVR